MRIDPMLNISDIPVALLAGGLATRLQPVSQGLPKALVPVAGRPFIDHQLNLLHRNGIRTVVMCLGHLGELVQHHVGDGAKFGMRVQYSFDGPSLLGTGGAIRRALPHLGDVFWVMYGDSFMDIDYASVLRAFDNRPEALGLMTVLRNNGQWDKSNAVFRDGQLLRYDKKNATPEMDYIDYGIALLRRSAAERIGEAASDIAELYAQLVAEGAMVGYEVFTRFYEIGTPQSLAEANEYLKQKR
jgi:NDP-sugar pyrophosphorylase family protein